MVLALLIVVVVVLHEIRPSKALSLTSIIAGFFFIGYDVAIIAYG